MTPEEVELLSELTIVIPTYNRPLELERAIEYWRDTPVTVHILDGSEKPWFLTGLLGATDRIFYHYKPRRGSDQAAENYLERIRFGVSLSKSKYSAICADDDFFAIGPLSKSISILNSSDSFDAIIGQPIIYEKFERNLFWLHDKTLNSNSEASHQEVTRRLFRPFQGSLYYGVVRTNLWKEIHLRQTGANFSNIVCNEYLAHFLASTMCRTYVIDEYLWLRNFEARNADSLRGRSLKFFDWLNDRNSITELRDFKNCLVMAMCLVDKSLTYRVASEFVEARMKVVPNHRSEFKKRFEISIKKYFLIMLSKLPNRIRRILFACLSKSLKSRLGDPEFTYNFSPRRIIDYRSVDLKSASRLEKVLLMPCEELRLRANI